MHEQPQVTSSLIQQTPPPTSQPSVQTTPGSSGFKDFPHILENIALEEIGDFNFVTDDVVKKLQKKMDDVLDEKKKLEDRVKAVESENSSVLKTIKSDQADIDILKVREQSWKKKKLEELEAHNARKEKLKELEAHNARKEQEAYMMKKVIVDLIGKPIEQRFEEIELEEVRAKRKAEIEAEMTTKGKGAQVEGIIEVIERAIVLPEPCPISSVAGLIRQEDDVIDDDDEEDDDDTLKDDADEVYSIHSDDNDDGNDDDDDDQGSTGIKVSETSHEEKIDEYLHDDANEELENASGEGEHDDTKNVDESDDHVTRLILCLEHDVEEGEIMHTYTLAEIVKMTHVDENEFNFDFEEELNKFDINQQPEYQHKYVEEADNYDRVEVEDWSDEDQSENVNVDTSSFLTLTEFFSQANADELRRKVAESVKNNSFDEMSKEERRKEQKKWFRKDT
ncbi:hypothetical protein Hdeb2414_s0003g00090461 [Helianthus debilis subsp. tardiflorus]